MVLLFGVATAFTCGSVFIEGLREPWTAGSTFKCAVALLGAIGGLHMCRLGIGAIARKGKGCS